MSYRAMYFGEFYLNIKYPYDGNITQLTKKVDENKLESTFIHFQNSDKA